MSGLPWVSALVALPLLSAAGLLFSPPRWAQKIALVSGLFQLCIAMTVFVLFDVEKTGPQLVDSVAWMPSLGARWRVGVDGLSVCFPPLVAILGLLAAASVSARAVARPGPMLAALSLLVAALQGVFVSLDLVLFFLCWEGTVLPLYALISLWGPGAERRAAAWRASLTLLGGGAPMLVAILLLANAGGSLQIDALAAAPPGGAVAVLAFALLGLSLAVKAPVVPLHGWMPTAVAEGPIPAGLFVLGLKVGLFGLLRLGLPLLPQAAAAATGLIAILGLASAVWGALVALATPRLRRLLAFLAVSHVGWALVGVASGTAEGLSGAVFELVHMGVVSTSLLLLAGLLYERVGSLDLSALGGLARQMPRFTAFFVLFALAGVGLPGTSGFVGELLITTGAARAWPPGALIGVAGSAVAAAALIRFSRAALGGLPRGEAAAVAPDLLPWEGALLTPMALLTIGLGLWPRLVLDRVEPVVQGLVGLLGGG